MFFTGTPPGFINLSLQVLSRVLSRVLFDMWLANWNRVGAAHSSCQRVLLRVWKDAVRDAATTTVAFACHVQ